MSAMGMRILVIGTSTFDTTGMFNRLERRGWGACVVSTLREGRDLLRRYKFDLVLSAEVLPEGRGYDISDAVAKQSGTLLVGIALSESWLWLPVVEFGRKVLGKRALNLGLLESEARELLGKGDAYTAGETECRAPIRVEPAAARHGGVPRRKKTAA
jgi:hypothetical protein